MQRRSMRRLTGVIADLPAIASLWHCIRMPSNISRRSRASASLGRHTVGNARDWCQLVETSRRRGAKGYSPTQTRMQESSQPGCVRDGDAGQKRNSPPKVVVLTHFFLPKITGGTIKFSSESFALTRCIKGTTRIER